MILLEAEGLGVQFSGLALFSGLSFSYGPGVVALMGENGAGKSTLLSLLAGVQPLQEGRIVVKGHDMATSPQEARRQLAWVPDESVAYEFMTGDEFLHMVLALRAQRGAPALPGLLEGFGLSSHRGKRFGQMSLGTRKKFMLASGLASDAAVVLMDEPTNGIDAEAKAYLMETFRQARDARLFLYSTHDGEAVAQSGARVLRLVEPGEAPWRAQSGEARLAAFFQDPSNFAGKGIPELVAALGPWSGHDDWDLGREMHDWVAGDLVVRVRTQGGTIVCVDFYYGAGAPRFGAPTRTVWESEA